MRALQRNYAHLSCWICTVASLIVTLLVLMLLSARAGATEAPGPAVQVVTAPWAAPSQGADYQGPLSDTPVIEPAPLPDSPPPPPLSIDERKILQATASEKLPEPTWLRFVVSNEWRHDVLFPRLAPLGGAYIGVATDQSYTLAAAARSQLVFMMDYDLEVVRMNRIHFAFLAEAATPQEFRALFDTPSVPRAKEILAQIAEPKEAAQLQRVYTHYRERLQIYLRHVAGIRVGARHPSWLGDPAAYAYIRSLSQGGRLIALQGDLNGVVTLKSIAATCKKLNVPVRAIYTSNAEGFFKYTDAFRENLAAMPHDDKTVMIRTFKHRFPSARGDTWHYNLHQLDDFLSRLALPRYYPSVAQVMADLQTPAGSKFIDPTGFSYLDSHTPRHPGIAQK